MNIKRGTVLLTDIPEWCMPHKKFAVVINETHDILVCTCLINSNPSEITSEKEFQIKLLANDYSFLSHDSYVDCTHVFRIDRHVLEANKTAIPKGTLNEIDLNKVLNAGRSERNIVLSKKIKYFFG